MSGGDSMDGNYVHLRDGCDGGICVKCNRCQHPECCPQGACPEHHWVRVAAEETA